MELVLSANPENSLQSFPGVCSPIRGNAHNQLHGLQSTTNSAAPTDGDLPHPSPLSCHAFENNEVTSIMTKNACENKQLTFQRPSENTHFAPGMQYS
jgi:hypothetical protein